MSESSLTPHTAPRTLDALMKETPFKLRLLVQALGGLQSEQDKMAWHDMKTPEARGQYVLAMLQRWDQANPGAAAPMAPAAPTNGVIQHGAPPQYQAPVQQMAPVPAGMPGMMPPGMVPGVAPGAAAAVAGATADKPKRVPRTTSSETAAPPADLGAEVINLLNRILKATEENNAKYTASVTGMQTLVAEASDTKNSAAVKKLDELVQYAQYGQQLQTWTLVALLTFLEQNMGAGQAEILGAVISDSQSFQALIAKATGKA